jgi:hypothetical protein
MSSNWTVRHSQRTAHAAGAWYLRLKLLLPASDGEPAGEIAKKAGQANANRCRPGDNGKSDKRGDQGVLDRRDARFGFDRAALGKALQQVAHVVHATIPGPGRYQTAAELINIHALTRSLICINNSAGRFAVKAAPDSLAKPVARNTLDRGEASCAVRCRTA